MSTFPKQLKLKERVEEDIYFAKRDRQLIKALRVKELAEVVGAKAKKQKKLARSFEKEFKRVTRAHKNKPKKLLKEYRKLLDNLLAAFRLRKKDKHKK